MSTVKESWIRLRKESWCDNPMLAKKNDASAKFMRLSQGAGPYKYDEYSVIIDSFPSNLSPIDYLKEFAMDLNKAVNNSDFNSANVFTKRAKKRLELGDVWDIDIKGPDNGSIVLVALSPDFGKKNISSWFVIQTIECDKYGTHPECGAREFGFEVLRNSTKFYTRGVSRAYMHIHRMGSSIQKKSWIGMLTGISTELAKRGAKITNKSVSQNNITREY